MPIDATNAEFSALPIIDISPLVAGEASEAVVQQVGAACRDVGFFYVVGHGISDELQQALRHESANFFALQEDVKREVHLSRGGRTCRGYFSVGEEVTSGKVDAKEGIYFGAELGPSHRLVRAGIPMHGPNLFPSAVPGLRPTVLAYMEAATQLSHVLMGAIALSLGLEQGHFRDRYLQPEPSCQFAVFRYPPASSSKELGSGGVEETWGVGEHTDYGVLTILNQDEVGGLQVKNRANHWVEAPPIPGSFIINLGDMLEKMTSGLYRSTPHRVTSSPGRSRMSFPFFIDPNFAAVIEPIQIPKQYEHLTCQEGDGYTRWDGAKVEHFKGIYGEYVFRKQFRAFPGLEKDADMEATVAAMTDKLRSAAAVTHAV